MRAPLRNTAIAALTTLCAMAGSNALYNQSGHHPAPLFGSFNKAAAEPTPEPVTVPAVSEALAEPAATDEASARGRELAPGKTVTVIPVASGPSVEADGDDSWLPSERPRGIVAGGGGTCRRRGGGGGIGIAARFRVSLPVLRLR